MSIVVSYEQQPPRRPTYASTAQKYRKLEMPQDMKHYEALLAITQALGMRHPKPRSLQPHPEMRQGFSLLMSLLMFFSFDFLFWYRCQMTNGIQALASTSRFSRGSKDLPNLAAVD
jgi:hypothetical protein